MFTVCPKCALTLVVTAADLRAGQGYVRCGRCTSVFNALVGLTDEGPAPDPASAAASGAMPRRQAPPLRTAAVDSDAAPAMSGPPAAALRAPPAAEPVHRPERSVRQDDADDVPDAALEFNPSAMDVSEVFVPASPGDDDPTGTFETIVLEGDDLLAAAETEPAETPDARRSPSHAAPGERPAARAAAPDRAAADEHDEDERLARDLRALAAQLAEPRDAAAPPRAPGVEPQGRPAGGAAAPAPAAAVVQPPAPAEPQPAPFEGPPRSPASIWARRGWAAGAALLAGLLAAQLVHLNREALAADPRFGEPLSRIYAALGLPLTPRWDVGAYEVRQLGAAADSAGASRLTVRASLKNAAARPQPLPLLRVTLQDRFGNRIGARDVPPGAYAPRTIPVGALLAAGQRIDAEMSFVDPGQDAVGFEIDACLPARAGAIVCASELALR